MATGSSPRIIATTARGLRHRRTQPEPRREQTHAVGRYLE
ncbi:hypothetical protein HMPREF9337_00691 [Cutibacterium acnes HL096PA3]|nr:hypothetical protein HMPREF9580_02386 [Cutibacterium acnes HL087PA2]EFS52890.1 hypothetical protein HMPREF9589_02074 [Cutibacterium acnes HL059PA1]EFS59489.1 hypothetical protein HMPREF9604_00339 [Cutibacterium acnes HL036PA1]EFS62047.1 hypothetical protein HMPREF9605_00615 [Cutibacterium acnes HL036PA2]EFT05313.1 hypothetical protein HMPREF9614_01166 [Cutibacterium acnes HL002PA2]EFT21375.1 hypothetical protein HMPREF9566_01011 [Cutibacterium acnes HL045PA1]EFT33050.1 hypothetical protein